MRAVSSTTREGQQAVSENIWNSLQVPWSKKTKVCFNVGECVLVVIVGRCLPTAAVLKGAEAAGETSEHSTGTCEYCDSSISFASSLQRMLPEKSELLRTSSTLKSIRRVSMIRNWKACLAVICQPSSLHSINEMALGPRP